MAHRVHVHPNLVYAVGAQVVTLADVSGPGRRTLHPRGAVGVIVKSPSDHKHTYRVRFTDGVEASQKTDHFNHLRVAGERTWQLKEFRSNKHVSYSTTHPPTLPR